MGGQTVPHAFYDLILQRLSRVHGVAAVFVRGSFVKQEDRKKILRWTGIFSLPWVILALLLWLVTRPEKPISGTEAVVEGRKADMALAPYHDSLMRPY